MVQDTNPPRWLEGPEHADEVPVVVVEVSVTAAHQPNQRLVVLVLVTWLEVNDQPWRAPGQPIDE